MPLSKNAISDVTLCLPSRNEGPTRMQKERDTAIADLIKEGVFNPINDNNGPYCIELSIQSNRLIFQIKNGLREELSSLVLSLNPYRRIIRDYFMMIESHEMARKAGQRAKLEPIDMARRGLHNEAAELMIERLGDKIEMDFETARRLFTLICVLHMGQPRLWRG